MMRSLAFGMLTLGSVLFCGDAGRAEDIVTDANIVTALDISDSVAVVDMHREIEGLALAIRSPEILAAIRSGPHGRIGFAVFAWHHDQFPLIVPWTLIASPEDAWEVAERIEARLRVDVEREARRGERFYYGRLTDLSQAIDYAAELVRAAPFAAGRSLVNIIGNGTDNVGEDAPAARDRIVATGVTVNGVVFGGDPLLLDYYRRQVVGGPGAFVLSVDEAGHMVEVLARKFRNEIAMARLPRSGVTSPPPILLYDRVRTPMRGRPSRT
ncbi:MAG: DUF1194 domain-containing protein [Dongiaceae bacterium]